MPVARIGVHPLVVAVAFGLIGPAAVAEDEEDALPVEDTADEPLAAAAAPPVDARAIDPAEFARVEAEWFAVRGLKVR